MFFTRGINILGRRFLHLAEYEGKELMKKYGLEIQNFTLFDGSVPLTDSLKLLSNDSFFFNF